MAFEAKTQAFSSQIRSVTVGSGENSMTLGGGCTLPFYTFDGATEHPPLLGLEIPDGGISDLSGEALLDFYRGCTDPVELALRAQEAEGVSFLCLHLQSADPNGENRSIEDCTALAVQVSNAIRLPLVILGCRNAQKDAALFAALAEALQGRNVLFLSAREENYKAVGASVALAYGQKLGAETSVDINLAKQLNVLLEQLGVPSQSTVMNVGAAAAGYGFEYVTSTLDRIRLAALAQNDEQLQLPILTPVGPEAWSVKEAVMPVEDMPLWGDAEERGIHMEIVSATACLAGGSDGVILRHPGSVQTLSALIRSLC